MSAFISACVGFFNIHLEEIIKIIAHVSREKKQETKEIKIKHVIQKRFYFVITIDSMLLLFVLTNEGRFNFLC